MKNNFLIVLSVCLLLLAGCGKNVQVKGKVTFEDGSPLTVGMLIFTTGTNQSKAVIENDGSYVVGTFKSNDGLPRGTYQVYITGAVHSPGIGLMGEPLGVPVELVDRKYTTPETSGLTCEVKGSMTHNITVTPPQR